MFWCSECGLRTDNADSTEIPAECVLVRRWLGELRPRVELWESLEHEQRGGSQRAGDWCGGARPRGTRAFSARTLIREGETVEYDVEKQSRAMMCGRNHVREREKQSRGRNSRV